MDLKIEQFFDDGTITIYADEDLLKDKFVSIKIKSFDGKENIVCGTMDVDNLIEWAKFIAHNEAQLRGATKRSDL